MESAVQASGSAASAPAAAAHTEPSESAPLDKRARAAARRAATAAAQMAAAEGARDDEEDADDDGARSVASGESDSEWGHSEGGRGDGAHSEESSDEESEAGTGDSDADNAAAGSTSMPRTSPGRLSRFASTGQTTHDQLHKSPRRLVRGTSAGAAAGSANIAAASSSAVAARSGGPLVCDHPGCDRSFRKVGKLNRHKLSHLGAKPFVCTYPGCTNSFTRNDRLRRHWKIHQARELELGGASAVTALNRAWASKHTGEHASFLGGSAEEEADVMRRMEDERMEILSGSDIEAIVPDAVFRHEPVAGAAAVVVPALVTGALAAAPVLPPLVKFNCSFPSCTYAFLLREHLKRHQLTHGAEYAGSEDAAAAMTAPAKAVQVRPIAPAAVPAIALKSAPPPKPAVSYPCAHPGCSLTFDKAHKLREHAFVHTGVMPWICNHVITKEEREDAAAQVEVKLEGMTDIAENAAASSSSSAVGAASAAPVPSAAAADVPQVCREGFMTRAQLVKHQHLCHDPNRHLCAEVGCGASFTRFQDLRKHRATDHRKAAMLLRCDQCGGTFKRAHDRDEHMQTHMSAEERAKFLHSCPFSMSPHNCSKAFTTKSNLNQHVRRIHDAEWKGKMRPEALGEDGSVVVTVLRFPCPFASCTARKKDKPYKLKQTLQRHLVSHHSIPETRVNDAAFIAERVAEHAAMEAAGLAPPPPPPHPNAAKRVSAAVSIAGNVTAFKKNLDASGKRKRKEATSKDTSASTAEEVEAAAAPAVPAASNADVKNEVQPISASDVAAAAAAASVSDRSLTSEQMVHSSDLHANKRIKLQS